VDQGAGPAVSFYGPQNHIQLPYGSVHTFFRQNRSAGAADVVAAFANSASSAANASSYTLSISNMLTSGHRVIAVAGRDASTRTINSVTLDGETATLLGTQIDTTGSSVALFIAPATANTTGDCVISLSGSWLRATAGVWNVLNLLSTTETDFESDTTASSNTLSVSIDCNAGGAVFGISNLSNSSSSTWSGITESYDLAVESVNMSGAFANFASAQTGLTVSSQGTASANPCMAVAALR
jgi:hypothetical protein